MSKEAEKELVRKGYGKGTNYTTKLVASLMQSHADQQTKELREHLKGRTKRYVLLRNQKENIELERDQLRQENEKLKEAGLNATELIAHLKDQHGFNEEEDNAFDLIRKVFGYKGDF